MITSTKPDVGDRVQIKGRDPELAEVGVVLAVDGHDAWVRWDSVRRSTWPLKVLAKVTEEQP